MKVSIITPCYNAADTITRTLDSIKAQTVKPFEYLIIDGGSTDGTVEIAKAHPAVTYVVSERDNGIADAFNKGIRLSSGDIIGIINADDWYEPDAIANALKAFEDPSIGVFHGALQYWDGQKKCECFYPNMDKLHKEMTLNHPTVFVRKSVYDTLGGFDLSYKYAMDYELLLRFATHGVQFVQTDATIANMSLSGVSDRYWIAAYAEVARAKANWLRTPVNAKIYLGRQICRTITRKILNKVGLSVIVNLWRRKCSIMYKKLD